MKRHTQAAGLAAILLALSLALAGCSGGAAASQPASGGTLASSRPGTSGTSGAAQSTGTADTTAAGTTAPEAPGSTAPAAHPTSRAQTAGTTAKKPTASQPAVTKETAPPSTQNQPAGGYTMYVKKQGDHIQVVQKYSPTKDFVMVLRKMGGNAIFNISSPRAIYNSEAGVSDKIDSAVSFGADTGESDWFGPHIVTAVQNKDGDRQQGEYTGGAHNYDNNANPTGSTATGRSDNIRLTVDGKSTGDFAGYAKQVSVTWDTYVQASNTKKADGSGREVLVEHHTLTCDGVTWNTEVEIVFLEDVVWSCYYGLQTINFCWNQEVRYDGGAWQSLSAKSEAPSKTCGLVTLHKGNDYLDMGLDSTYGIGNREYLYGKKAAGAFVRVYGPGNSKAYFDLVDGRSWRMKANASVRYRGHYKFYYQAG